MTLASTPSASSITIGVLAIQGGFVEHIALLRRAADLASASPARFGFVKVRTAAQLAACHALVIPGGESTTMALVAGRLGLLEPLRQFVKIQRRPTWGTCAGLIMLAEHANAAKKGGQDLIGGLDVRVHRNHFGRQVESFEADLHLPFLGADAPPFPAVFIRAPIVEEILDSDVHDGKSHDGNNSHNREDNYNIPPANPTPQHPRVEVLALLPARTSTTTTITSDAEHGPANPAASVVAAIGEVVAVRQGNVFGTSFHPELTDDVRIHVWWLKTVEEQAVQIGQ